MDLTLLGISKDSGRTWKFVDGTSITNKNPLVLRILPKLPAGMKFPANRPFEYVRDDLKFTDAPNYEGRWMLDSHLFDGKRQPTTGSIEIQKGAAILTFAGQEPYRATLQIDSSQSPPEMDLTYSNGPAQGMSRKGIYLLDGDVLKLCFHPTERPKTVDSTAGSNLILYVLKRSN